MRIWKQAIVSLVLLSAAAMVWARYFPGAAELLERAGIATASVEPARAARSAGGPRSRRRRRWSSARR